MASGWAIASAAQELASPEDRTKDDDGWTVLTRAQGTPERITALMVAEAALAGDPDSLAILARARTAVAFALTQAITLLAPRRIVFGGGVSLLRERLWFDPIRRLIEQRCLRSVPGTI